MLKPSYDGVIVPHTALYSIIYEGALDFAVIGIMVSPTDLKISIDYYVRTGRMGCPRQMLMDLSCMRIGTKTCVCLVTEKMVASSFFRFLSSLFFRLLSIKIIHKFELDLCS